MGKLSGKIALITGGSSGIGLATARQFAGAGAGVAITGRDPERLKIAAAELGSTCLAIQADAGSMSAIEPTLQATIDRFGVPDILFLNAGIARYSMLAAAAEADFEEMMALHVKVPFFTVKRISPLMARGSSIIFTTSINNRIGMPSTHLYAATKAAAAQLVRTLAAELGPAGIRVNAICPGATRTDITRTTGLSLDQQREIDAYVAHKTPLGRFADAREPALAALFLACEDSSYVNAHELVVDGGWTEVNA